MSPPDFSTQLETAGAVDVGRIHFVFRVGDLAKQFRDIQGRLRAELRNTMEYLGRETRTVMASLAPVGKGNLRSSIDARIREGENLIHLTVRPRARYAPYVEGGTEFGAQGRVEQSVRRPPSMKLRKQASRRFRIALAKRGGNLVKVREYSRYRAPHPFIRPTYQDMVAVAQAALQNAVARATRETA